VAPDGVRFADVNTLGLPGRCDAVTLIAEPDLLSEHLHAAPAEVRRRTIVAGELSNTVAGEIGDDPIVLFRDGRDLSATATADGVRITAAASCSLDHLVAFTCEAGVPGVELLAGIPGTLGGAVVQNAAAYGQCIGDAFESARAFDLESGREVILGRFDLRFGYRSSALNARGSYASRFVLLTVSLRLPRAAPRPIAYADLARHHRAAGRRDADIQARRRSVIEVRSRKGMVVDGPNWIPSAGSFFIGPEVGRREASRLARRVRGSEFAMSYLRWYRPDGANIRVPAALALRAAGFMNGDRWGPVGLSPHHILAICNLGGASAGEVIAVSEHLRREVKRVLGLDLRAEVKRLGRCIVPSWDELVSRWGHTPGSGEPRWALEMGVGSSGGVRRGGPPGAPPPAGRPRSRP
jgi:UDP-N-acetylmuramate dehydrogenase